MANITFEQLPKPLVTCMMQTENYVNSLKIIDHSLMELMRYYVSVLNGCVYCVDMHFQEAIAAGESKQRLYSVQLWRKAPFYSEQEQALLGWAECVTSPKGLEENQHAYQTMAQHFTVEDVANLTLAIVQINSWTRLATPLAFEAGHYKVGQY